MSWKDDDDKVYRITWAKLQSIYEEFVRRGIASDIGLSPGVFFLDNMSKMRESPALAIFSSRFIAAVEQHFPKEKGLRFRSIFSCALLSISVGVYLLLLLLLLFFWCELACSSDWYCRGSNIWKK